MIGATSVAVGRPNLGLRRELIASVLEVTICAWPIAESSASLSSTSLEEDFTGELVTHMRILKDERELQFSIDEEVGTRHRGARKPTGRIDIKIRHGYREEAYLGIECKRVGATNRPLAKLYLDEGVMRFITAKYSPGHPLAMMIGFVIDGDRDTCAGLLASTMSGRTDARIVREWQAELEFGVVDSLYSTHHTVGDGGAAAIVLLHLLLSYGGSARSN